MGVWYGRDDTWPEHSEKWWRDALPKAQAAGWWLDKFVGTSSHRWGKLKCRRTEGGDTAFCVVRVDTSGQGAENVARDVPKKIRNCPHRSAKVEHPGAALAAAREQIAGAARLLDAVERLVAGSAEVARVHDLLDDAFEKAIEEAERSIEEAERLELDAFAEVEAARRALSDEGLLPSSGAGLLAAEDQLARAQGGLNDLPERYQGVGQARADLDEQRARADALRARASGSDDVEAPPSY